MPHIGIRGEALCPCVFVWDGRLRGCVPPAIKHHIPSIPSRFALELLWSSLFFECACGGCGGGGGGACGGGGGGGASWVMFQVDGNVGLDVVVSATLDGHSKTELPDLAWPPACQSGGSFLMEFHAGNRPARFLSFRVPAAQTGGRPSDLPEVPMRRWLAAVASVEPQAPVFSLPPMLEPSCPIERGRPEYLGRGFFVGVLKPNNQKTCTFWARTTIGGTSQPGSPPTSARIWPGLWAAAAGGGPRSCAGGRRRAWGNSGCVGLCGLCVCLLLEACVRPSLLVALFVSFLVWLAGLLAGWLAGLVVRLCAACHTAGKATQPRKTSFLCGDRAASGARLTTLGREGVRQGSES